MDNRQGSSEKKSSSMEMATRRLDKAVNTQRGLVEEMKSKLGPVLCPEPPVDGRDKDKVQQEPGIMASPLVREINGLADLIETHTEALVEVLDRIQL